MKKILTLLTIAFALAACSHTYYVVRHAEKQLTPQQANPPLTDNGEAMAQHLKALLADKKIKRIFSTNTVRTTATAAPLAQAIGVTTELYGPKPDSAFIQQLKNIKHNTLVVGHSNTVDDIVNGLGNAAYIPGDLDEKDYGGLYMVTVKGKRIFFKKLSF
jgi:phosphohistidine phosphatase SixA